MFSQRVLGIRSSVTLAMNAQAKALRDLGRDVINLSVGEPDFSMPHHIAQAAMAAIQAGHTRYPPVEGYRELREAIVKKFERDNQLTYCPEEILVSNGAKQSLYNATSALLNSGDQAIIPAPYWVSYPAMVALSEAKPVIIPTQSSTHYKINAHQLEQAITPRTKLLFINSPSNPTGMCYSKSELKELGAVLKQHPQIIILSDDIYEHILWSDAPFVNLASACPELKSRCIVINGVSKAYAMTGWRIGYCAAQANIIAAMKKIQSHTTSAACSISQYAAIAALTGEQGSVHQMVTVYKQRCDRALAVLKQIPFIQVQPTEGSFYLFCDITQLIQEKGFRDDVEFCSKLLKQQQVALVPGSAFGLPHHFRLSTATCEDHLNKALERLAAFVS